MYMYVCGLKMKNKETVIFLIILSYILFFFYYPLIMISKDAVYNDYGFTLEYISSIFYDASIVSSIVFSFWEALISVFLSLLIGIPVAYIITKYDFKGKNALVSIMMVPFILPGVVVAYAILTLYGVNGYFTQLMRNFFGFEIILGQGLPGIFIAHVFYNAPLAALIISSLWKRIDPELEYAADVLGSGGIDKFFRLTLPLISPGILSASLIIFIFCFTSFEIILILGGAIYRTMEVEIYTLYLAFFDFHRAAALSLLQLFIISLVTFMYLRVLERVTEVRKIGRSEIMEVKNFISSYKDLLNPKKILILLYLVFFSLFMILPIVIIFISSIIDPITKRISPMGWITLFSWTYNTFLGAPPIIAPINTLMYSIIASALVFIISMISARFLYDKKHISIIYGVLIFIPVATSRITLGLGMISTFGLSGILFIDPRPLIIIAHTIIAYPFATRTVLNGYSKIDPDLIDISDILGASKLIRFIKVELPLLKPSLATSLVLAFAISAGEFAATNLLYRSSYATLTVFLYLMIGARKFLAAGAAAALLSLITFVAFFVITRMGEDISSSL